MAAKKQTTDKPEAKNADTGTEQGTATGTEQGTVTLKTSFYCHEKEVSFTAGDDYDCDAETAMRLISNNMAKL